MYLNNIDIIDVQESDKVNLDIERKFPTGHVGLDVSVNFEKIIAKTFVKRARFVSVVSWSKQ